MRVWKRRPWSTHWDIRILVPISYLKLWNYIYRPSVPLCPSSHRRPSSSVLCPSVPSSSVLCPSVPARPVVVVHPMTVRPVTRLVITYMTACSIGIRNIKTLIDETHLPETTDAPYYGSSPRDLRGHLFSHDKREQPPLLDVKIFVQVKRREVKWAR